MTWFHCGTLLVMALLTSWASGKVVLRREGFVKLPTKTGTEVLAAGTANKAAYDDISNLLYVIGHTGDVLNIIDMSTSMTSPTHSRTIIFEPVNQGLPNDIKVCRGGQGRDFLAISFESKSLTERGHVHFYQLLSRPQDAFIRIKTITTVEGFDPRSMAWNTGCSELIVASKGAVHTINGAFEDPRPSVDVLVPSFGLNVDRRTVPFSESALKSAGVRQVFKTCDSGTHTMESSHVQDLEPTHVTVDSDNIAYMIFQPNNAIGKFDMKNPLSSMVYYNLGHKDWSQYKIDTSYEDGGIKQFSQTMKSLYQPSQAVTFQMANKTWVATADTGYFKSYNVRSGSTTLCNFQESSVGASWRQGFSSQVDAQLATELNANLSTNARLGRLRFSRLKAIADGYNPLQMSYNYLTTYGGRGWSLIDGDSMKRVYDSGDIMETFFTSPDVTDSQKATYNGMYGAPSYAQSQNVDRASPAFGPNPTAIATGNINGTQVVVVANGYVGGLYVFSVTETASGPGVAFEGYDRRGSPGLRWDESYKQAGDGVGEPGITDLLWINDEGTNMLVSISSIAGAASFYSLDVQV